MKEHDFPTVRKGSYILLGFAAAVYLRALFWEPNKELTDMAEAILTAVASTHALLVVGAGFINSKFASPTNVVETRRVVTEEQTVTPKANNAEPTA